AALRAPPFGGSRRCPGCLAATGRAHLPGPTRPPTSLVRSRLARAGGCRPRPSPQGGLRVTSPVARGSDRARPMPTSSAARHDDITAVLDALRGEQRRLERLGLELPLARCHEEIRYWGFLAALHSLPTGSGPGSERGGSSWPDARVR